MSLPPLGFIILRHVNNRLTDYYWKEAYVSIRRFYPDVPVIIVDDSSDRKYVREDIILTNCTVIYDYEHKGCAESLPYSYFYRLRPFERAVIIHDSVFLQRKLDLTWDGEKGIQFLWSIPHYYDQAISKEIHELINVLPEEEREGLRSLYHAKGEWTGAFGVMSIVKWDWLKEIVDRYGPFDRWFPLLTNREYRSAMERVFGLLAYHHNPSGVVPPMLGGIQQYIRWGITFTEYITNEKVYCEYPVMKVWSGR